MWNNIVPSTVHHKLQRASATKEKWKQRCQALHTTASVLSQITFHQGHACSAHNNRIQHDLLQLFFNLEFLLSELQVFEWLQEKLRSRRANTPNTEGFLEKEIINYVHRLYGHEESWYVYLNQYSRQAASSLASRNSIFPRFWFP